MGEKAPRVPSVFERKLKWRTYDSDDEDPRDRANYPTVHGLEGCRSSSRRRLSS